MIPKIIHYVWVGGNPLTPLAEKCIESWKKYCPDYEIKRWDETNFNINENAYCKEAYESKKWAFVADYIRLKVLYEYGGVYMDTDVEVIKPFSKFLNHKAFVGYETDKFLSTGIIAAEQGNAWIKENLDYYNDKHFLLEGNKLDLTTNVVTVTKITQKMYPSVVLDGKYTQLELVSFYPKDYFSPISPETKECEMTKNTCTIHHFSGSWLEPSTKFQRFKMKIKLIIKKIIGKKNVKRIRDARKRRREKKERANENK